MLSPSALSPLHVTILDETYVAAVPTPCLYTFAPVNSLKSPACKQLKHQLESFLFPDDYFLEARAEADLHEHLAEAIQNFGLAISQREREAMWQPPSLPPRQVPTTNLEASTLKSHQIFHRHHKYTHQSSGYRPRTFY